MEKPIIMGNFMFCSWQERPLLGNECKTCDYIRKMDNEYYCIYEAQEENYTEGIYPIKTIIETLLDKLISGQRDMRLEELEELLLEKRS